MNIVGEDESIEAVSIEMETVQDGFCGGRYRYVRSPQSASIPAQRIQCKEDDALLENKNAIVYGGGGFDGGVARAFAREGAHVFLDGRAREKLEASARDIEREGGSAAVAVLDALDDKAVDEPADTVVPATHPARRTEVSARIRTTELATMAVLGKDEALLKRRLQATCFRHQDSGLFAEA